MRFSIILTIFGAESKNCVDYFGSSGLSDDVKKCSQESLDSSSCRGKYDIGCLCRSEDYRDAFLSCVYYKVPFEGFESAKHFSETCNNSFSVNEKCLEEKKEGKVTVEEKPLPQPKLLDEDVPEYHIEIKDTEKTTNCSAGGEEKKPSKSTSAQSTKVKDSSTTCTLVCVTRSKTQSSKSTASSDSSRPTQSSCLAKGNCSVVVDDANSLKVGILTIVLFMFLGIFC
ncbi:hypothetical protein PMAC_001745 [Pneumocystis sp. 'macacae']|nr:hypothetical protein PMAC_001745 [Pneumocystis sp. 'macacae']